MELHLCSCCGAHLDRVDDHYECPYCGSYFEDDFEKKCARRVEEVLEQAKLDALSKAKRVLYDATHANYISKENVRTATMAVLTIDPDDPLACFHRAALEDDPQCLNDWLLSAPVSASLAKEVIRYTLLSLNPRNVFALKDFAERQLEGLEYVETLTKIENEAGKFEDGLYEPSLPRDVFLCYSGKDQEKVMRICDYLEENGFTVFAAYRNLRHGQGAVENYMKALEAAMRACKTVVFLSSKNSRSMSCDAVKKELLYIQQNRPKMGRIEYILDSYQSQPNLQPAVKLILTETFKNMEWCTTKQDLIRRLIDLTQKAETVTCPSCGKEVEAGIRFCPHCSHDFQPPKKEGKPIAKPAPAPVLDLRQVISRPKHRVLMLLKVVAILMFVLTIIFGFIPGAANWVSQPSQNFFASFIGGVYGIAIIPIALFLFLAFAIAFLIREAKYARKGKKLFVTFGFIFSILGLFFGVLLFFFYVKNMYQKENSTYYTTNNNVYSGWPLLVVALFYTFGSFFTGVNTILEIGRDKPKRK